MISTVSSRVAIIIRTSINIKRQASFKISVQRIRVVQIIQKYQLWSLKTPIQTEPQSNEHRSASAETWEDRKARPKLWISVSLNSWFQTFNVLVHYITNDYITRSRINMLYPQFARKPELQVCTLSNYFNVWQLHRSPYFAATLQTSKSDLSCTAWVCPSSLTVIHDWRVTELFQITILKRALLKISGYVTVHSSTCFGARFTASKPTISFDEIYYRDRFTAWSARQVLSLDFHHPCTCSHQNVVRLRHRHQYEQHALGLSTSSNNFDKFSSLQSTNLSSVAT